MNKEIDEKIKKMVKSMYKTVQNMKEKDAISDVLDKDRIAEMSPDSIPSGKSGILNKNKEKMKKDMKKDVSNLLGIDPSQGENMSVNKNEEFVKDLMKSFTKISSAYIEKMSKKED